MNKIRNIRFLLFAALLSLLFSCKPYDRYVTISGYAQGGVYSVKLNLNGRDGMIRKDVHQIQDSIDAILESVDKSLSGYNKNSLLSRFNAGIRIVPDSLFVDIYLKAYEIFEETSGVVDVAAGPLFDIWGFGFKNGSMPDDTLVSQTLKWCGMKRLHGDIRSRIMSDGMLSSADMLLDEGKLPALNYNAIAQGYSCDLVAQYLYSIGVKDMLVDIGEIYCDGKNPSGRSWSLGIDSPVDGNNTPGADLQAIINVPDGPCGVVTSGNYRKYYVKDGRKYSHSIDPRSGYPVSHNLLSATIIAPDATLADAYATYCMVIGLEDAKLFIENSPDLEGCLIYDQDGTFGLWHSSGVMVR